ncbi:MAG TPA: adenylate/guanylate cyclase domain-containing protein, partial [Verrucomicrobiales bacterium]|nr:adenylate/guanylate cyclase domain-containing protein [Verrucomicrobiales bacterium]
GNEAIVALTQGEFDLVLLDLVMPEKNGFEVLNWMRQSGQLSHTPVIIISGMDSDANAIRGIEMGAEDFLGRPIDLKLLRARVDACLERQRLREKEFAQYFTPDLARHLVRHPQELRTGRQIEVSVLFCDIVGFSRVSERLGPEATLKWLSQVLGVMSACVMDEEGVLVDYTGDQIMALWGAPKDQPDHASRACRSALAMLASLPALDAAWRSVIRDFTEVSIGISTGEAYVGNVGTERKFKYGALGNTVNLGSRVQGATKYVRAKALLTADTWQRLPAGSGVLGRRLGKTRVNNILEPVELYELAEPGQPGWDTLRAGYERALACFESGGWQEAATCLTELLREHPGDGPSLILLSRAVEQMLQNGSTPKSFDPVWSLPGK